MKDLKSSQEANTFAPITISFTIETRDELVELWARMNVNQNALVDAGAYEHFPLPQNVDDLSDILWAEFGAYLSAN